MTKVAKSKIYRSHTSHRIVTLPCPFPQSDPKWHETHLYRTLQGVYFLSGHGGSRSRWAKSTQSGTTEGKGVEALTKDEALAYVKYAGLPRDKFARAGFDPAVS